MNNVRDIRKKDNLYFVLSDSSPDNAGLIKMRTAIIVFLYYEEDLDRYLLYLDDIPSVIDIYIVYNNSKLQGVIAQFIKESGRNIELVTSNKRGRDISALLVACRDIVLSYEYICFVHDKKKKNYMTIEDSDLWIENLWENSIGSKNYILNVLNIFEMNENIGLLVPPEPIGKYIDTWYFNGWESDFELTKQLARKMDLKCDLDQNKAPITLGTVFWARSIALKKLFDKHWKYEDFDEEPLKNDGTISHAIERILGYVAQDAGYDTGTIMNTSYAGKLLCFSQEYLSEVYPLVKENYRIHKLWDFLEKKNLIYNFCKKNPRFYLYGAGKIGKRCLQLLRAGGYEPEGYLVSDRSGSVSVVDNVPVKVIEDIDCLDTAGVIITVGAKLQEEIESNLKLRGITNYIKY